MRRRALVLAIWLVGTAAATTMALAATNLVGNRVTDAPRSGSGSEVAAGSASTTSAAPSTTSTATSVEVAPTTPPGTGTAPTSGPAATSPTTAPPPPTTPPPTTTTGTFQSEGGTLGAACEGTAVRLVWASPKDGFAAEVHDSGPAELEVRFSSEEHESRVKVRCAAGAPMAEVEERDESSGSGSD